MDETYSTNETIQEAFLDGEFSGRDRERDRVLRLMDAALTIAKKATTMATLRDALTELHEDVLNGVQFLPETR